MAKPKFPFLTLSMFLLLLPSSEPMQAQAVKKYWVYFVDKGSSVPPSGALRKGTAAYERVLKFVQPRALARRANVLPHDALVDAADLPLY